MKQVLMLLVCTIMEVASVTRNTAKQKSRLLEAAMPFPGYLRIIRNLGGSLQAKQPLTGVNYRGFSYQTVNGYPINQYLF